MAWEKGFAQRSIYYRKWCCYASACWVCTSAVLKDALHRLASLEHGFDRFRLRMPTTAKEPRPYKHS